jgi:glycosyltransferase involved in cell wall biosynthesis
VKILILSDYFPPNLVGGAEIVAWNQFNDLTAQGHEVIVITKGVNPEVTFDGSVFRVPINESTSQSVLEITSRLNRISRIDFALIHNIRELGNDVLVYFLEMRIQTKYKLHDFFPICEKSTLTNSKHSICLSSNDDSCFCLSTFGPLKVRLKRDLFRYLSSIGQNFTTPSQFYAESYRNFGVEISTFESNGLLQHPEIEIEEKVSYCDCATVDHTRFVFSGYLGEHKGVENLISVFTDVFTEDSPSCCLTIMGEGHLENKVRKFAYNHKRNVHYLGRLSPRGADQVISNSDCLVLPSIWLENEPVSVLQALSKGIYVLSTNQGGLRELFHDELTTQFDVNDDHSFREAVLSICSRKPKVAALPILENDLGKRLVKNREHLSVRVNAEISGIRNLIVVMGNAQELNLEDQKRMSNAPHDFYYIDSRSLLSKNSRVNTYVVLTPEYEKDLLSYALRSGKVILTPRVQDFGPSWNSPKDNLYQFSTASELLELLDLMKDLNTIEIHPSNILRQMLLRKLNRATGIL